MYNRKYIDFKNTVTLLQLLHCYSHKALRCNSFVTLLFFVTNLPTNLSTPLDIEQ